MAAFTCGEILAATGGILQAGTGQENFTGVSTDSRTLQQGDLFIALVGEHFDGHNFVAAAIEAGAAGVVVSRPPAHPPGVAVIVVTDTRQALQNIAHCHRRRFNIPLVAVTGSNGKTTTKDMIAAVLGTRMRVLKTTANYNNEIGLPLTLLALTGQHQAAVVELGMRGKGQIAQLAAIAEPDIGVVTNVGETHLELLGSVDNIAAAKRELIETLPPEGVAVLNGDDARVAAMARVAPSRVVFYGCSEHCQVRATNVSLIPSGITFSLEVAGASQPIRLPVPGRHNVYNALAAAAVGMVLKLPLPDIAAGLAAFIPSDMRLQVYQAGSYVIVNDAYNASPLSMAAAIDTLAEISTGRTVAVLGDMLELGPVALNAHRRVGDMLAAKGVALVVTVGQYASYIAEQARRQGVPLVYHAQDHAAAKEILQKELRPGDTVLVKGSRGMHMEKLLDIFIPRT